MTEDNMKFVNVLLNLGDGYNRNTGMFTAPIDGVYSFTAQVCNNEDMSVQIRTNHSIVAYTQLLTSNIIVCGATTGVVLLDKGDVVGVFVYVRVQQSGYNQFIGHLI